jgi:hypothetical protein
VRYRTQEETSHFFRLIDQTLPLISDAETVNVKNGDAICVNQRTENGFPNEDDQLPDLAVSISGRSLTRRIDMEVAL